jgi:hypothetical protein
MDVFFEVILYKENLAYNYGFGLREQLHIPQKRTNDRTF